jgi:hypothetical protein
MWWYRKIRENVWDEKLHVFRLLKWSLGSAEKELAGL